jgi:3-methyladenine DNA glycosylase AlkD
LRAGEVIGELRSLGVARNVAGMARFGINPEGTLGVSLPDIRRLAQRVGKDHSLADELWRSGIHEGRILASLVDDPVEVTESQMDDWACDFDSWDVCDQVCSNLFDKTPFAHAKALEWSAREEEFVKRAGFVMMAALSVHDKASPDKVFLEFLPVIERESVDERNFVKKAVNWALRQIGKRNLPLNRAALRTAKTIAKIDSRSARWVASDALRELTDDKVQRRLRARSRTSSR